MIISSENTDIKISKDLIPSADSSYDLGSSNYRYAYGYFDTCSANNFRGTTLCVGTTTVGSLSAYSIKARADSTYDIGTSTMRFRTGYFDTVNTSTITSSTIKVDTISGTYSGLARPDNYHLRFNEKINLTSTTSLVFGAGDVGSIDRGESLKEILDDMTTSINNITNFKVVDDGSMWLAPGHTYLVIKRASKTSASATLNIYSGDATTISGTFIYAEI